jgi:hypothetical protein
VIIFLLESPLPPEPRDSQFPVCRQSSTESRGTRIAERLQYTIPAHRRAIIACECTGLIRNLGCLVWPFPSLGHGLAQNRLVFGNSVVLHAKNGFSSGLLNRIGGVCLSSSPGEVAPRGPHGTVLEPLGSHGSCHSRELTLSSQQSMQFLPCRLTTLIVA